MKTNVGLSKILRGGSLGLAFLVLLVILNSQTASAAIKATAPFYSWDRTDGQFKNSNVSLWLDPDWWVPMIHELGNDKEEYPNACGEGTASTWAGTLTMGLGHVDTTGGQGFQSSEAWTLVHCDRDGDGDFDNADLSVSVDPGKTLYGFTKWDGVNDSTFRIEKINEVSPCLNSTCSTELITTMFINLDSDCDGDLSEENIPPGGLCFYAEVQPPAALPPYWQGNLQARISAGGGDKTVNHTILGPTAITVAAYTASSASSEPGWRTMLPALVLLSAVAVGIQMLRQKRLKAQESGS